MNAFQLTTTAVLNETSRLLRRLFAPWCALLVLTVLPYRLMQVFFIERLVVAGSNATHYGGVLTTTATWTVVAFLLATAGRLVFARACRLERNNIASTSMRDVLRVGWVPLFAAIYTSLAFSLLLHLTMIAILPLLVVPLFTALAVATAEFNRSPSLLEPFRIIRHHTRNARVLAGVLFTIVVAFLVMWINLFMFFRIGLWAAGAIGGYDLARWSALLHPTTLVFTLLLIAVSLTLIEPLFVAAHVSFVGQSESRATGDDLRAWLQRLRTSATAEVRKAV